MARFNKAKNFLGKSYVVSNEIETLIKSMNFKDDILKFGANKIGEDNVNLGLGLDFSTWVSKGTVGAITGNALVDGKILVANGESAVKDSGYTLGAAQIKEYILEGEGANYDQAATTLATEAAVMHAVVASSVDYGDGLALSEDDKKLSVDIKL